MKAFIYYSHKDDNYLERLKVHLAQMKRDGFINELINQEINAAAVLIMSVMMLSILQNYFLVLLSCNYIASNYCFTKGFLWLLAK